MKVIIRTEDNKLITGFCFKATKAEVATVLVSNNDVVKSYIGVVVEIL
jgi:hypothetical protein